MREIPPTLNSNADVASCLVHARPLLPDLGDGVVTPHGVEMVASVEPSDDVDQQAEGAHPVVCSGRLVQTII